MNENQSIEFLVEVFKQHVNIYKEQRKAYLEKEGKHTVDNEFSLPEALLLMCQEIAKIKQEKSNV